jgi:hypothetical protein|nr:MAG: capsid protein [Crogonang virus 2]
MYKCIGEKENHSIADFLNRYTIISQGAWASTAVRGDVIANLTFPKQLFNTGAYEVVQNTRKLDGFTGFKAKVRVRIEVNSQPFQAGALLLHYIPYSEYMVSHTQWYATASKADPVAASGCPHTVMNLANSTSMEFVTPYISPYLYFNLPTGQGSFGNVVISVISPLSSQSASSANYTIWAKFEDVELRYPTDAPLTTSFAQVGNEIAQMENRGSISSTVGSVGNAIADFLPWVGLGWLSAPTRLVSSAGEKTLKMLGFSKPSVEAPLTRTKPAPTQFSLNSDGSDTSHKLGLSAANALITPSGWAGTDDDEMRLDLISARPCYTTAFNWASTDAADKSLYLIPVSPMHTLTASTQVANAYARQLSMPLCAKVASFFSLWRGTMVYRIQVVKTQFHSGRLRISYRPYAYTDTSTIQNMPAYSYTEEIDLATGSDFTFEVPFVSVRPWMHTYYDLSSAVGSGDVRNCATGAVQISVINPLVNPSTVSSTVEVLVYSSMKDAQFACPIKSPILPYNIPNTAQMGRARIVKTEESSVATSTPSILPLLPYSTCVGEVVTSFRQLLKRYAYLGKVSPVAKAAVAPATGVTPSPGTTGTGFVIYPWAPVVPQTGSFTVTTAGAMTPIYPNSYEWITTKVDQVSDTFSQLYSMFAFYRGAVRYKIVINKKGSDWDPALPVNIYINNMVSGAAENWTPPMQTLATGSTTNLGTGPIQPLIDISIPTATTVTRKSSFNYQPGLSSYHMVVYPSLEGTIEFEVPFHASGHMCPTTYGYYTPTQQRSLFYPFPTVTVTGTASGTGNTFIGSTFDVFRSVGDDFSFGGLLGAPSQAIWSSTTNPT